MSNSEEIQVELESRLQKFKPSKHMMAYKVKKYFNKRCYARKKMGIYMVVNKLR